MKLCEVPKPADTRHACVEIAPAPDVDEAIDFIISRAREVAPLLDPRGACLEQSPYGDSYHHLTIEQLLRSYFDNREMPSCAEPAAVVAEPIFIEAAWELCLRGVLRPGGWRNIGAIRHQGGYCITRHGQKWLSGSKVRKIF